VLLTVFLVFLEIFATVLKANTKTHLVELVKEWDSWKTNCIKLWKGVAPVLDLISPELPEDQPHTPKLTPVEKAQQAWGWLQQFVKDVGEFAGAHVLSMVCAHYHLVDLSRLERGYPKEVGPKEADDLRIGLLDLSSTVIGDINLYWTSTPSISRDQTGRPGSCRGRRLQEMSGRRLRSRPARLRWPRPLRRDKRAMRVISPSSRSVE
jgi:hypothetical protein